MIGIQSFDAEFAPNIWSIDNMYLLPRIQKNVPHNFDQYVDWFYRCSKSVANISNLSSTQTVSNIRHQHQNSLCGIVKFAVNWCEIHEIWMVYSLWKLFISLKNLKISKNFSHFSLPSWNEKTWKNNTECISCMSSL